MKLKLLVIACTIITLSNGHEVTLISKLGKFVQSSFSKVMRYIKNIPKGLGFKGSIFKHTPRTFRVNTIQTTYSMEQCLQDSMESELPPHPGSGCCGVDVTTTNVIIGGEPTGLRQYPWLALVEYTMTPNSNPLVFCGGFLISSRYVVTAAHCDTGEHFMQWAPTSVRLGDYDRTNPGEDCIIFPNGSKECTTSISIPIELMIVHEDYHFNRTKISNDIALIKLLYHAPHTDHISPICLPPSDLTKTPENSTLEFTLIVAGWGTMKQIKKPWTIHGYHEQHSNIKLHDFMPYVPYQECQENYPELLENSHICAGGEDNDSCMGDSGGPIMYNRNGTYEAVGIVSYGPAAPCGIYGVPAVYTKVADFKDWIMENIQHFA